jgi:large subunit ribosomal protein L3
MANENVGLLGRKLGMTQIYDDAGNVHGVTVLEVQPNTVLQVKTGETRDGYSALQLGIGARKASRATKAEVGHAAKANLSAAPRYVREIRVSGAEAAKHTAGAQLAVGDWFKVDERVDVTGTSKGRGFSGVMKRYNFSGFKRTHGAHEYKRHGGSIGTRLTPGMTFKGVKMPGHMGDERVVVQNLKIVKIDTDRHLVYVRGGVPGADGADVIIRKTTRIG